MHTKRVCAWGTHKSGGATTTPDSIGAVALFVVPEFNIRIDKVINDQAGGINGLDAAGISSETAIKDGMAIRASSIGAGLNSGSRTLLKAPIRRACLNGRCHRF